MKEFEAEKEKEENRDEWCVLYGVSFYILPRLYVVLMQYEVRVTEGELKVHAVVVVVMIEWLVHCIVAALIQGRLVTVVYSICLLF